MSFSGTGAIGGAGTGAGIGGAIGGGPGAAIGAVLGGIGGGLFGDEGGSTTARVENRPWNRQTRTGMIQAAEEANRLAGIPMTMFPGQTYADFDPLQEVGLEGMSEYAADVAPGMVSGAQDAWQSALGATDIANNPYVSGMIGAQQDLLNRNLTENLLPSIGSRAMASGQGGGSRQGIAEGIALRGTQEALADAAARTQLDAYGRGLTAQTAAMGMTPQMLRAGMFPGQAAYDIGSIYQGMDQQAIDEAMARHNFEQEEPWDRLNRATVIYGGTGGTGGSTTTTGEGISLADRLLGSAATLGSAWLGSGMPGWPGAVPVSSGAPFVDPYIQSAAAMSGGGFASRPDLGL